MMHRLLIGYCVVLFMSCFSKQPVTKKITVIYCPEINNKTSFNIPKEITGVFKSQNIDSVNYEIITDSKIKIINGDFDNSVEVPIFNSLSQMIFGSPTCIKTNELITSELHTIRFEKKNSRKPYPSEPTESQIFIFYNTQNTRQTVGRKDYVNSSDQISKVISKHINEKKNFYIFNSTPHVLKSPYPAPPIVPEHTYKRKKNSPPIDLQAIKSPGCILQWSSKTGANVSPKISTDKLGTFKYYVSQKNLTNKLESKQIEIIVIIQDNIKVPPVLQKFPFQILRIDKSDDGKLLTWKSPFLKKENRNIQYTISFVDLDNNNEIHRLSLSDKNSYEIIQIKNKFKNGARPSNDIEVIISANCEGYVTLIDTRILALNSLMRIYNCY